MRVTISSLACIVAFGLPGVSQAATFSGQYALSGEAFSEPGLVIEAAPKSGPFNFSLDAGQSKTIALFDIWTNETSVDPDDRVPNEIVAGFQFSQPVMAGVLKGSAAGQAWFSGVIQNGRVEWSNPLKLAFGNGGSGVLTVALSEETFNWGVLGTSPGRRKGATIDATFSYEVAVAPLPGALPLLASALGMVAVAVWRRRSRGIEP